MTISGHIRKYFCELTLMDCQQMLMSVNFKETSQEKHILWGEEQRKNNG